MRVRVGSRGVGLGLGLGFDRGQVAGAKPVRSAGPTAATIDLVRVTGRVRVRVSVRLTVRVTVRVAF